MMSVLVVDDDPHILRTLEILLRGDGRRVLTAPDAETALGQLEREPVEAALVDLQLPGLSGLELLRRIRDRHPGTEVVIITAHGTVETAVEAMKEGAFDYLTKPFSPDQVRHRLGILDRLRRLRTEVSGLQGRLGTDRWRSEFVTRSPAMLRLLETARTVAATEAPVLITGESGTGKSRLARLIHAAGPRAAGPFAAVDCTSFAESLFESELFGHARGAFTGATADRPGKVAAADGGTLLLDEVAEIPVHLQAKLLRLVEERLYERVGDPTPRRVDARVVAATHRDLPALIEERAFRRDLYFRLAVVELTLPALRRRPEDIPLLGRHFLARAATDHHRPVEDWDADTERLLAAHPWPGNVRELAHVIERAVLVAPGRILRPEHLPDRLREPPPTSDTPGVRPLAELEEEAIRRALAAGLPLEETARRLGIDPSTLWRKRKRFGI